MLDVLTAENQQLRSNGDLHTKEALASMIKADYAVGSLSLMPVCIAISLITSRRLQISLSLQQKLRGYNIGL